MGVDEVALEIYARLAAQQASKGGTYGNNPGGASAEERLAAQAYKYAEAFMKVRDERPRTAKVAPLRT